MVINIDDQDMALNEQVGQQTDLDTTPVAEPETVGEVVESEVEPTGDNQSETTETTRESKKGFENRVRELNRRAVTAEERARSLESKIAELTRPVSLPGNQFSGFNPQEPIVAPGEEIDVNELNRRIAERDHRLLQTADARAELRQRQMEATNRITSETSEVLRIFPELDPDSDEFNAELSETITEAVEARVRANPYSASVKQFVAKLMKPYKGAVDKEVGKATENLAKQVSQAALRPNSVRKQEKTAEEKSIAELEAELGVVQS